MKTKNGKIAWKSWENRNGDVKAHAAVGDRCLCGSLVPSDKEVKTVRAPLPQGCCAFCRQIVKIRAKGEERAG